MPGSILFQRSFPLAWSVVPSAVVPANPEQNHLIFGLLDSLDENITRKQDKDQTGEWQRLEAKLNIILQLLGQLLQNRQALPVRTDIRFSSDTLSWQVDTPPPPGSLLEVLLYPEDSVPLALRFTAGIVSVNDHWLVADIRGLSEDERAIWSRWVFRQHRRQVAMTRATSESV